MQLVIVSPMMTASESSGHFYWAYKKMRKTTKQLDIFTASISMEGQDADAIYGLLKRKICHHNYYSSYDRRTFTKIEKLVDDLNLQNNSLFHFYDGGFGDLVLIYKILRKYPKSIVLLNLHWSDSINSFLNDNKFLSIIERQCIKRILNTFSSRIILMAESESLSEISTASLGVEVIEYPVFSVYDPKPIINKNNDFLLVVHAFREFEEIYDVVREVAEGAGNLNLTVLTNKDTRDKIVNMSKASNNVNLVIIDKILDSEEYETLHRETKTVILPYKETFYKFGSSGRLLDAYNFGCNVVVPDDLELSKKSEQLGIGYSYKRGNRNSILDSLNRSMKNDRLSPSKINAPTVENALIDIQSAYKLKVHSDNYLNSSRSPMLEIFLFKFAMRIKWSIMLGKDYILSTGYNLKSIIRK